MSIHEQPLVSVVMVIRNIERYLTEAIESILHQTFRDFEFIIVDFGSKDKSFEIASSYAASDKRIKLSQIAPCSYIEAKIAACALPKGKYIAIQDADDVSFPERLEVEVSFLEGNPEHWLGGRIGPIDRCKRNATSVREQLSGGETRKSELNSRFETHSGIRQS